MFVLYNSNFSLQLITTIHVYVRNIQVNLQSFFTAIFQHSLTYDGLKDYIIKGADGKGGRVDLIDANREGLYSCLGFLSIYIMGVQLGKIVMRKR